MVEICNYSSPINSLGTFSQSEGVDGVDDVLEAPHCDFIEGPSKPGDVGAWLGKTMGSLVVLPVIRMFSLFFLHDFSKTA